MMSNLEMRALNLRRTHAITLMNQGQAGGLEALAMIVCPSQAVLDASMEAARPLPELPEPRREPESPVVRRAPRRRQMKASMTLDEILAAMS